MTWVRKLGLLWCLCVLGDYSFAGTVVDPTLIIDQEETLKFLKNPEYKEYSFPTKARPGKCPLKSFNHVELIMQLTELERVMRNTHCDTRGQKLVSNLAGMASSLRNTMILHHGLTKGGLIYAVPDVSSPSAPQASASKPVADPNRKFRNYDDAYDFDDPQARAKELLRHLSAAAEDPKCVEDLHKAGVVSVLADMTVSLGQSALFVPGPNGLAIGIGTLAIAATLKVISALLQSPYNWALEKDRLNFLDLNCNFFDLRKELEETDFFDIRGEGKAEKVKKGKQYIEVFDEKIAEVQVAKSAFEKNVLDTQNEFLEPKIGAKQLEFYRILLQLETALSTNMEIDAEARHKVVKDLIGIAPNMIPILGTEVPDASGRYFTTLFKPFLNETLSDVAQMESSKLQSTYVLPMKVHMKSSKEKLEKIVKPLSLAYQKQSVNEKETNGEVIERGMKVYAAVLKELTDKRAQLLRRLSYFELGTRKGLFSSYENGAHMDFDVSKEYDDSRRLILGNQGWSFLKYLIRTADRDADKFLKNYQSWLSKYQKDQEIDQDELAWACRDANQLRVKWKSFYSAVGMAFDFYETNKGILSSEFGKMRWGLHLVPLGRSNYLKIYRNIRAMEMAKSIVEGSAKYSREEVRSKIRGHHINLGELVLKVKDSEEQRNILDEFFKKKDCLVHL